MSQSPRVCRASGRIVPARTAVPDDLSDYNPPRALYGPGCSRLRCLECGVFVRNAPNLMAARDASAKAEELYETDDWSTLPYIEKSPGFRLYACRCTVYLCVRTTVMHDPGDFDPLEDVQFPWRCAGHPPPTLPLDVDGASIRDESDVRRVLGDLLGGWTPSVPGIDDNPTAWLVRLHLRLQETPLASVLGEAVAHGDLGVALMFFSHLPDAPGAAVLLARLEDDPVAAAGSHVVRPATYEVVQSAPMFLAERATVDARSRTLLRSVLGGSGGVRDANLLDRLAAVDGDWLARNAGAVVAPEGVSDLLGALARNAGWEFVTVAGIALVVAGGKHEAAARTWATNSWASGHAAALAIRTAGP